MAMNLNILICGFKLLNSGLTSKVAVVILFFGCNFWKRNIPNSNPILDFFGIFRDGIQKFTQDWFNMDVLLLFCRTFWPRG